MTELEKQAQIYVIENKDMPCTLDDANLMAFISGAKWLAKALEFSDGDWPAAYIYRGDIDDLIKEKSK
jgi:hypothetical protein